MILDRAKLKKKEGTPIREMITHHLQMMWRVALITVGVMAIVGGGGYFLDKSIKTFPLFMIIGLVVSYPLSQIIIYKVFIKLTKKKNGISPR